jgi:hypothetical protein
MDPNTTRAAIRELLVYIDDPDSYLPDDLATQLNELIEHVDALDNWLSHGGHLPAAWNYQHDHRQEDTCQEGTT